MSVVAHLEKNLPGLTTTLRSIKEYIRGEPEIRKLKHLVPPGKLAIDIGANNGVYTFWLKRYSGRVLAIEPNPQCATILKSSFKSGVKIINAACSNQSGTAVLTIPSAKGHPNHYRGSIDEALEFTGETLSVQVRTGRLDDMVSEEIGFIKIDVEGHELDVIKGSMNLLKKYRPVLLIEAEDRHKKGSVEAMFEVFKKLDYDCLFLYRGQILNDQDFSLSIHQAHCERQLGARDQDYVNNFMFLPRERQDILHQLQR
jgi:FkbM family methyltransferase